MRTYLAGPMTGLPNLNFPEFHRAAASLRASGYEVVSPAEIHADADATVVHMDDAQRAEHWVRCMRADIAALLTCEAIALLPRWEKSRGASLEASIAHALGMRPIYLTVEPAP